MWWRYLLVVLAAIFFLAAIGTVVAEAASSILPSLPHFLTTVPFPLAVFILIAIFIGPFVVIMRGQKHVAHFLDSSDWVRLKRFQAAQSSNSETYISTIYVEALSCPWYEFQVPMVVRSEEGWAGYGRGMPDSVAEKLTDELRAIMIGLDLWYMISHEFSDVYIPGFRNLANDSNEVVGLGCVLAAMIKPATEGVNVPFSWLADSCKDVAPKFAASLRPAEIEQSLDKDC